MTNEKDSQEERHEISGETTAGGVEGDNNGAASPNTGEPRHSPNQSAALMDSDVDKNQKEEDEEQHHHHHHHLHHDDNGEQKTTKENLPLTPLEGNHHSEEKVAVGVAVATAGGSQPCSQTLLDHEEQLSGKLLPVTTTMEPTLVAGLTTTKKKKGDCNNSKKKKKKEAKDNVDKQECPVAASLHCEEQLLVKTVKTSNRNTCSVLDDAKPVAITEAMADLLDLSPDHDIIDHDHGPTLLQLVADMMPEPLPPSTTSREEPSEPGAFAVRVSQTQSDVDARSRTSSLPQQPPPELDLEAPPQQQQQEVVVGDAVLASPRTNTASRNPRRSTQRRRENSNQTVIEGTLLPEKDDDDANRSTRFMGWALVLSVLVLGSIGIALLAVFVGDGNASSSSDDDDSSSSANVSSNDNPPIDLFPTTNLSKFIQQSIHEPENPYFFAYNWLLQDPSLQAYSWDQKMQRFQLAAFYNWTHGDAWHQQDDWLDYNKAECDWTFQRTMAPTVLCDDKQQVVLLNMSNNNLRGTMPATNQFLSSLVHWDLSNNHLSGSLTINVNLPKLETFILSNNEFEGFMTGNSMLSFQLKTIRTNSNSFGGDGRSVYRLLPDLEFFDLSDNQRTGTLATQISYCTKLREYNCAHNLYFGAIPSEMGLLTNLQYYNVSYNAGVNATIPTELGLLTSLEVLDVLGTSITGPIPEALCHQNQKGLLNIVANCSRVQCCEGMR